MKNIRRIFVFWLMLTMTGWPSFSVQSGEKVVMVEKDNPAPFTGLLVPELRFTKLLEAEITAEKLAGELKIQKDLTDNLEQVYNEKLREAVKPLKWYETPAFNRWLGFGIGIVVTGLAVWGGIEIAKAVR